MTPIMPIMRSKWYVLPIRTADELAAKLNELERTMGVEIKHVLPGTAYSQFHVVYTNLEEISGD